MQQFKVNNKLTPSKQYKHPINSISRKVHTIKDPKKKNYIQNLKETSGAKQSTLFLSQITV